MKIIAMKFQLIVLLILTFLSCSEPEEIISEPDNPIIAEEPKEQELTESQNDSLTINSVFPQLADLGDTLNLKGKNFSRDVRLTLGYKQLKILFNNDSIIQFELPYFGFEPDSLNIKIDNRDTIIDYKNAFQLYLPEIDSIPSNFGLKDTVVVYGKHLTNQPEARDGIIELNNNRISVLDHNKDSIRFILPYNVNKHENNLLLKAQLRELSKEKAVIIQDPVISGVSKDSLLIGESITIYGSNFFEFKDYLHEVYIGEKRAEIEQVYGDSIIVKVPLGPYEDRDIDVVTVKVVDKEVTQDLGLYLKNIWYLYGYKRNGEISRTAGLAQISNESFYHDNAYYFSVYDYDDKVVNSTPNNYRLYKYTPENNTWEKQIDIPLSVAGRPEQIQIFPKANGELYLYVNREFDNFYKYNFLNGELLKLEDFDYDSYLGDVIGFYQNDSFYFGGGYANKFSGTSVFKNRKFWKYSEVMDSWTNISEIPDVPGQYQYSSYSNYFENNGKIYICNGDKAYETWEFTPDETWVRKADLNNPISQTVFTQIGDKGFFYHYLDRLFYEYDITNDIWSRREALKVEGYNLYRETMFVHDGYVYLVGSQNSYTPDYTDFFNYDHIILRTEISNFTN
tara:strand:- start:7832 stop:9697 length:1866 start_codon:yes stop_codon:yes gene_type:complete